MWRSISIFRRKVPSSFLEKIIDNGCKHLSLLHASLIGKLSLKTKSKFKYLDLTGCELSFKNLKKLLSTCDSLEKLSLQSHFMNLDVEKSKKKDFLNNQTLLIEKMSLQNGHTLQVLNLAYCELSFDSIKHITKNCVQLEELCLADAFISKKSVNFLVKNLTPNVKKLSLYLIESVKDKHINELVKNCNQITELNLGKTSITNLSIRSIIKLKPTLEKIDLSCTDIDWTCVEEHYYEEIISMPKLKNLNWPCKACNCCHYKDAVEFLQEKFPNLKINEKRLEIATPRLSKHNLKINGKMNRMTTARFTEKPKKFEPISKCWGIEVKELHMFKEKCPNINNNFVL